MFIFFEKQHLRYLHESYGSLFRNMRFMLDEMPQRNASKFAIFLAYRNPCIFFRFSFCATLFSPNECPGLCRHSLGKKIKYHEMENRKSNFGFSVKKMANFEAFRQGISSSINLLFLRSVVGADFFENCSCSSYIVRVWLEPN